MPFVARPGIGLAAMGLVTNRSCSGEAASTGRGFPVPFLVTRMFPDEDTYDLTLRCAS